MTRPLVLLLSLFFYSATIGAADDSILIAGVFSPARPAPDFSLRASDGTDLRLSRYRGKVVALAFGYTSCTAVCPITLSVLAAARKKLDAAADQVQIVYVTVDPERDNAERMRQFLHGFDPSFVGGTGTAGQLAAVRADYGISVSKKIPIPGGYALNHSSYIYLIDRNGSLRALMPYGHSADDFAHDMRMLLKQ
ncbi:MAG TPA: SCO family protein [Steroidobacteraceae bacterium]|nr:SCO family protein [Steroidobacteraceae bacterium]